MLDLLAHTLQIVRDPNLPPAFYGERDYCQPFGDALFHLGIKPGGCTAVIGHRVCKIIFHRSRVRGVGDDVDVCLSRAPLLEV